MANPDPSKEYIPPKNTEGEITDYLNQLEALNASPGWKLFQRWCVGQGRTLLEQITNPQMTSHQRDYTAGGMAQIKLVSDWVPAQIAQFKKNLEQLKKGK